MTREEALERLRPQLQAMSGPMSDAAWEKGARLFRLRRFDAGAFLVRAGEVAPDIYFVVRGLLRQFYLTPEGREYNKSFSAEDEPCGAFHSSLTATPSRFHIQALEDTVLLQVSFAGLTALFETERPWERLGRRAAEQQALINEAREAELLLDSATERYLRFRQTHPGLEGRIAQYHVASYLGITDVALSRIRRRLREGLNPGS